MLAVRGTAGCVSGSVGGVTTKLGCCGRVMRSAVWWSDALSLSFRSRMVVSQCCSAVGVSDRDMLVSIVVLCLPSSFPRKEGWWLLEMR